MENSPSILSTIIIVMRWIARILAAFMILLTLVFFLGEEVFDKNPGTGEPIPITMIISDNPHAGRTWSRIQVGVAGRHYLPGRFYGHNN